LIDNLKLFKMVDDSYAKNKSATLVYLHFPGGGGYIFQRGGDI